MKAIEQAIEARALKLANSRLDDKRGSYEWALDAEITLRECAAALSALRSMPAEPYAYAVYFPDQPTEELVHDLDELLDDMTNREHTITELFTTPPPAPVLSDAERDCAGGMPCTTCPDKRKCQCGCIRQGEALATPQMVLSDAEIEEVVSSMMVTQDGYVRFSASLRDFARAIERAAIRASKGGKL